MDCKRARMGPARRFIERFGTNSSFDEITKAKLKMFTNELIEADMRNTEYYIGRFLFNYLRYRQSFGEARSLIRSYYPTLEKFANVKEIREFYYHHRGHNPISVFMISEFVKLVNWLIEKGRLPMIKVKNSYNYAHGKVKPEKKD